MSPTMTLQGRRLVLGVTGSIAAYKAVGLLRALTEEGASVSVVMTKSATRFVTPLTFEVLSGMPVTTDLFQAQQEMKHLSLPQEADAVVVAPATANFLAKAALGLADDVLSTMLLTARCPLVVAPAMDGDMWEHETVQDHVRILKARGVCVVAPENGSLASGKVGTGRLAAEAAILAGIHSVFTPRWDWAGQRVLVSAGPTHEPIDPVRYLSNRSSGKMGYALAEAARDRGAEVRLVTGPTALPPPRGIGVISVTTAEEMARELLHHFPWATVVIMAAAVADFRPRARANHKIKRGGQSGLLLDLEATPDILAQLSARRTTQFMIGFAAETDDVLAHAQAKLASKGLDMIVANDVTRPGAGFGSDDNAAVFLMKDGRQKTYGLMPKRRLADGILSEALPLLSRPQGMVRAAAQE